MVRLFPTTYQNHFFTLGVTPELCTLVIKVLVLLKVLIKTTQRGTEAKYELRDDTSRLQRVRAREQSVPPNTGLRGRVLPREKK